MIRFIVPLFLIGSAATAQDWSFQIDVDNGAISEAKSGSSQAEFSMTGPYFSAETFAIVPAGPVPACSDIDAFEIDFFFGWSGESNAHVMTKISGKPGAWEQEDPWLILAPTEDGDVLTDEDAELTFDNISCVSDDQISIAMSVRAKVVGETGSLPVTLKARAIAPIYHIDDY